VQAIREENLPVERLNQSKLMVLLRWFKRDGDEKLPTKKADQLLRYHATCSRGDMPPPTPPHDFLPSPQADELPPLPQEDPNITLLNYDGNASVLPASIGDVAAPSNVDSDDEEVARILLSTAILSDLDANSVTETALTSV